jgi:hypothetical protein
MLSLQLSRGGEVSSSLVNTPYTIGQRPAHGERKHAGPQGDHSG